MHIQRSFWVHSSLLLSVALAAAQSPADPASFDPTVLFEAMDKNRDGLLTREDITDKRSWDRFQQYLLRSRVTDGRLTRDSFLKAFQQSVEERLRAGKKDVFGDPKDVFRSLDRNGNDKLDSEEIQLLRIAPPELARWDTNQDGIVDSKDFKGYLERVAQEQRSRFVPSGSELPPSGRSTTSTMPSTNRVPAPSSAGSLSAGNPEPVSNLELPFDLSWYFAVMDRNGDGVLTKDDAADRRSWERLEDYLLRTGSTDGRLTRESLAKAVRLRVEEGLRRGKKDVFKEVFGDPKNIFRSLDYNGDKILDPSELQPVPGLRSELTRWDTNQDGIIAEREFTGYLQVFELQQLSKLSQAQPAPSSSVPSLPMVYRAGKLPPGMPPWFMELDRDGDAQIGLYEWKGRPLNEFKAIDRNDDGVLSIEEVLRYLKINGIPSKPAPKGT